MSKEELERELEELELIDGLRKLDIHEPENEEEVPPEDEAQGIDDLIKRMDKVTIEKEA